MNPSNDRNEPTIAREENPDCAMTPKREDPETQLVRREVEIRALRQENDAILQLAELRVDDITNHAIEINRLRGQLDRLSTLYAEQNVRHDQESEVCHKAVVDIVTLITAVLNPANKCIASNTYIGPDLDPDASRSSLVRLLRSIETRLLRKATDQWFQELLDTINGVKPTEES